MSGSDDGAPGEPVVGRCAVPGLTGEPEPPARCALPVHAASRMATARAAAIHGRT
jgi:hypothetical protein